MNIVKSCILHFIFLVILPMVNFSFKKEREIIIPIEMVKVKVAFEELKNEDKLNDVNLKENSAFDLDGQTPIFNKNHIKESVNRDKIKEIKKKSNLSSFETNNLVKNNQKFGKKIKTVKKNTQKFIKEMSKVEKINLIRHDQTLSIEERYEQILHLWFSYNRNKLSHDIAFETDYAIIRIRINQNGEILFSKIEEPVLPEYSYYRSFIENLISISSPVPKVPSTYSHDQELEFLVPIEL